MIIKHVKKITNYRFLNLFAARYTDQRGVPKEWIYASRSSLDNPMSDVNTEPDAVVIVPFHVEKQKLVIIKEFRVALGGYQYGFPAGLVDKGETIEQAGKRELFEETGLLMERVLKISPPIYSSSGLTDESVSLLFVDCSGEPTCQFNEASEEIDVLFFSQKEARNLLQERNLKFDVKTWIILDHFAQQGTG